MAAKTETIDIEKDQTQLVNLWDNLVSASEGGKTGENPNLKFNGAEVEFEHRIKEGCTHLYIDPVNGSPIYATIIVLDPNGEYSGVGRVQNVEEFKNKLIELFNKKGWMNSRGY